MLAAEMTRLSCYKTRSKLFINKEVHQQFPFSEIAKKVTRWRTKCESVPVVKKVLAQTFLNGMLGDLKTAYVKKPT